MKDGGLGFCFVFNTESLTQGLYIQLHLQPYLISILILRQGLAKSLSCPGCAPSSVLWSEGIICVHCHAWPPKFWEGITR